MRRGNFDVATEGRLLLVEDRESLRRMLTRALESAGYQVEGAESGTRAIDLIQQSEFDLVLTDLKLPGASGLEIVAACRRQRPAVPVVVMTAYGTVDAAVEAMKLGALDFLEKPVEIDELYRLVASVLEPDRAPAALEIEGSAPIVGSHPRLRAALHLLRRVAPTDSTVLLTGESGTGKELFARALHALSPRKAGPFVAVNCAAIPEALLENELFGHERGAFTGAARRQSGRFEAAAGGTLLLDEIGELGIGVQAKVLRVLEERTFERVGGGATLTADVRLVAATNRNLSALVDDGRFRADLFYRLDVFPIELPALRDRSDDIPELARHLVGRLAQKHREEPVRLSPQASALLADQPWPGNVRQLANLLERAVILAERPVLDEADLAPLLAPLTPPAGDGAKETNDERERLRQCLVETDGDKHQTAEKMGWSYRTLLRRIKEHDLEGVPRYRSG